MTGRTASDPTVVRVVLAVLGCVEFSAWGLVALYFVLTTPRHTRWGARRLVTGRAVDRCVGRRLPHNASGTPFGVPLRAVHIRINGSQRPAE
jgi:hypothetical protein